MLRFARLTEYELFELQENIKDIIRLKKNNYISDLDVEELEEIKITKEFFENVIKDFRKLGI